MKLVDIVANALEMCDGILNPTLSKQYSADVTLWHDNIIRDMRNRRNKIRDWYLRRLIKSG